MKVAIVGTECTGKSTLTQAMAHTLGVPYVQEYARAYLPTLGGVYTKAHLSHIAQQQYNAELAASEAAQRGTIICDTDLHNIRIWSEIKYNSCALDIVNMCVRSHYDLYILCDVFDTWQQDGLREYAKLADRLWLQKQYVADMVARNASFILVTGTPHHRLALAMAHIQKFAG